jgi:hypothetical protein
LTIVEYVAGNHHTVCPSMPASSSSFPKSNLLHFSLEFVLRFYQS